MTPNDDNRMPGQSLPTPVLMTLVAIVSIFLIVFVLGLIAGAW